MYAVAMFENILTVPPDEGEGLSVPYTKGKIRV